MFGEYKDNREDKKRNFLSKSVLVIVENAFAARAKNKRKQ
jgi:hypothetical protein